MGGVAYILAGFCFVLAIAMIESSRSPVMKQAREERRLEQLLWEQSGAGRKISQVLTQLELAEAVGAVKPERAAEVRKKLERTREELRRKLRGTAREMLKRKQAREALESER